MSKKAIRIIIGIVAILAVITTLSACTGQVEPEFAGPIIEDTLQALSNGDHAGYCQHFDNAMKLATPKDVFDQVNNLIEAKIGDYVSKKFSQIEEQDIYTIIYYKAKFTRESGDVLVQVVFRDIDGEMLISGLWFDSPKLRQQ